MVVYEQVSLRGVQRALEFYHTKTNNYPENLEIIIKDGYLEKGSNKDLHGNEYFYKKRKQDSYELIGKGPDGLLFSKDDICVPVDIKKHLPEKFIGELTEIKWLGEKNRHFVDTVLVITAFILMPFILVYDLGYFIRNYKKYRKVKVFKKWNTISICSTIVLILTMVAILTTTTFLSSIRY
ncbi:MAG: hypothetical protein WCK36_01475 [Candidatus Firestonebacteria bacterium]